jgi:phosphopantothenoylcysteine synthetase/decarboxylase
MKSGSKPFYTGKRILITGGPTWVPIDAMRVIGNRSTGTLSHLLAVALADEGATITLLEGPVQHPLKDKRIRVVPFVFFDELAAALEKEVKTKPYDIVIHAAAVSDFKLQKPFKTKIDSANQLVLTLVPTEKLITKIKRWAPRTFLVGFKLAGTMNARCAASKTAALFSTPHCDLVIANSIQNGAYEGFIVGPQKNILAFASTREHLVRALVEVLKERL